MVGLRKPMELARVVAVPVTVWEIFEALRVSKMLRPDPPAHLVFGIAIGCPVDGRHLWFSSSGQRPGAREKRITGILEVPVCFFRQAAETAQRFIESGDAEAIAGFDNLVLKDFHDCSPQKNASSRARLNS
jgi:hypothetical protein